MSKRRLGRTELFIDPLVFGCNVLGWTLEEQAAHPVLDAFVDGGFSALDTAERLRDAVAAAPLAYRGRILGAVTVSVGVAASPEDSPTNTLINRADAALLEAKRRGRNRSVRASGAAGQEGGTAA